MVPCELQKFHLCYAEFVDMFHFTISPQSTFFRYPPFIINDSTFLKKANDCFLVRNEKQYGFWNAFNEQQKP